VLLVLLGMVALACAVSMLTTATRLLGWAAPQSLWESAGVPAMWSFGITRGVSQLTYIVVFALAVLLAAAGGVADRIAAGLAGLSVPASWWAWGLLASERGANQVTLIGAVTAFGAVSAIACAILAIRLALQNPHAGSPIEAAAQAPQV